MLPFHQLVSVIFLIFILTLLTPAVVSEELPVIVVKILSSDPFAGYVTLLAGADVSNLNETPAEGVSTFVALSVLLL